MMPIVVCLLALLCSQASGNYVFTRTYRTGNALPLTDLDNFVASLPTSGVHSIQVTGSDGTNFVCSDKSIAQQIVTTWKEFGTYPGGGHTFRCGGEIWYTSGCCGHTIEIGGPFGCSCTQKWSIRSGAGCSWGTNWGGTTCPARGPLTLTINVVTCSSTLEPGSPCALGGVGCTNCLCNPGYEQFNPPRKDCDVTDMCATYGYSGQNVNLIKGCVNNAINQRTITCKPGYFVTGHPETQTSITLVGSARFPGCSDIDECNLYGYSNRRENTQSCSNLLNARTITCLPGFYAIAPDVRSVTLVAGAPFLGCTNIDECQLYGYSGKPQFTRSCTNGINSRTIFCLDGYGVVGTSKDSIQSIILGGAAPFTGCKLVDTCSVYGYSGKPENTKSCTSAINSRTIVCAQGYYPKGHAETIDEDDDKITLIGPTPFAGCIEENLCTTAGYSGKSQNTKDCTSDENRRTITCDDGYHAEGSTPATNNKVTLVFHDPFLGCTLIDNCNAYGFSGNQVNADKCTNGVNTRTITCKPGYFLTGSNNKLVPPTTQVTLTGSAPFPGCSVIDMCALYGNSGKPSQVISCVNGINTRNITCDAGYFAVDGAEQYNNAIPWILLTGNKEFKGCQLIPTCKIYGYSGKTEHTLECAQSSPNVRVISCLPGYYAVAPDDQKVSLTGSAPFLGCTLIDNCAVYGHNGLDEGFEKCVNDVNKRTISCQDGYAAIPPKNEDITLVGKTKFTGCTRIDMCAVYGYRNKPENVLGCVNTAVNERTIMCDANYAAITLSGGGGERMIESYDANQTLVGPQIFTGCGPWCGDGVKLEEEDCEDGNLDEDDGCDEFCKVQPGWMCSRTTPGKCCKLVDTDIVLQLGLVCLNGFFTGSKPGVPLIIAGPTQTIDGDLSLCGDVRVGYADSRVADIDIQNRMENLVIPHATTLTIAGSLYLDQTAVIAFHPDSLIKLVPHCGGTSDPSTQLTITPSALLKVKRTMESGMPHLLLAPRNENGSTWSAPGPFITATGCGTFLSWDFSVSTEGDFSSGKFSMISANCGTDLVLTTESVIHRSHISLNASCPSLTAYPVNSSILVEINQPNLCTGQILGIVLGTVLGLLALLALLGLLAWLLAAPAAANVGEGGGYVAM